VAIIMDGNGRWATSRGQPRTFGHRKGAEAVRRTIEAAVDLGISYLTLYGFSLENWKRPLTEIADLMGLLRLYLSREIDVLMKNGVRIRFIGDRSRLPADVNRLIEESETRTRANARLTLIVAMSYGSRQEIVAATRAMARAAAAGKLDPEKIDEDAFARHLETADVPDPDLVIRTSGEKRVSNFLLWQLAYSELIFIDTLWPDFARADLEEAIREFHRRERRYGATAG
jgi:undecaprenyl diphosphate synthase